MIRVKKFSIKYEEFTFYYVAIYNSETYTEAEIDNYINLFTHDVIERYDGIIFMLEKDWHWLHEMILKDYTPKEFNMNNTEKKIEELENRIKELETITSAITYTMGLMFEAIQNNASLIGQLTTIIEENIS